MENLTPEKYPYKPDVIMCYKGQKICAFVLSERDLASDSHKPDGVMAFRMRLLERAHKGAVRSMAIGVPEVVRYDMENCALTSMSSSVWCRR